MTIKPKAVTKLRGGVTLVGERSNPTSSGVKNSIGATSAKGTGFVPASHWTFPVIACHSLRLTSWPEDGETNLHGERRRIREIHRVGNVLD